MARRWPRFWPIEAAGGPIAETPISRKQPPIFQCRVNMLGKIDVLSSSRPGATDDGAGILHSVAASCAATTEAPHWRKSRRGRIPKEPLALAEGGTSDTVFPSEVQSFLNYLIAGFLQSESSSDPHRRAAIEAADGDRGQ